jgi:Xaa-Pro aminopeptidase
MTDVIRLFLKQQGVKKACIPEQFPAGLAARLKRRKVKLKIHDGPVFPERAVKCVEEVKRISGALTMAEVGLAEAIQALKSAKIGRNRRLFYRGAPLTSEKLRAIIDTAILQAGGLPRHTIVAGGRQGCDPHEIGYGPLHAHEAIVIDVFPRSQKTGYYGDLTRTVVKGRASEPLRRLYHTVARGQEIGFHLLMDKAVASEVHRSVQRFFEEEGYRTGRRRSRMEGFFHGTGHGVGLDLHEAPRLSANSGDVLRAGHVVALEPGLYYPSIGGVRLEDMALVTNNGARNLTKFEKVLEI